MPAKPIIEPIERSNSPATISSAAPIAITPRKPATVPQLMMPSALNMPEPEAPTANSRKTSTAPASAPDSGRLRNRRQKPIARRRSSAAGAAALAAGVETWALIAGLASCDDGSAVLAGVLLDLADVVLGHEARAGQDVARAVDRREAVLVEARLHLRVVANGLGRLVHVGRLQLLHRRHDRDRDVPLQVRLLVDRELHRAVLDALGDLVGEVEGGEPGLALQAHLVERLQRRAGRVRAECEHGLRVRVLAQPGGD